MQEIDESFFHDIAKSGLVGILQQEVDCQDVFPLCTDNSYRHPDLQKPFLLQEMLQSQILL